MPNIEIISVASSNPELRMTQREAYNFYRYHDLLPEGQIDLYRRLLLGDQIEGRNFGLDRPEDILGESQESQIERFTEQGRMIGADACRKAMEKAGVTAKDISGIVANTCTGYICPGFTSYLAEDLDLNESVKAVDIMGMGCGSAIPNLECACGLAAGTGGKPVISVSIEICSATHFMDDEAGLTVSNCIFGDGAAATVLVESPDPERGLQILDFESGLYPRYREKLRYTNSKGYLRNRLTREVPVIGAKCLAQVVGRILDRNKLEVGQIDWWAIHAGGTEVLKQVGRKLGVSPEKLQPSIDVFKRHGNMSSPTVIFALEELVESSQTDGFGLILAFGAGFTAFAALACGRDA